MMISKRRSSYFGHVCQMNSYRLPKIMLHSQLLGDNGSLSRGRGAPEISCKSALLEDMRNFEIMDRKSKKIVVALIHLSGKCYWKLQQIELDGGKS